MKHLQSRQFFDGIAAKGLWQTFDASEQGAVDAFIKMWEIGPGSRVLEPGCGCGRLTELLAEKVGSDGQVVAVDISPAMIASARRRGLPAQVQLLESCLMDLSPAQYRFDQVICCNVWPHLGHIDGVLDQIAALLEEGGSFWISHLCSREKINHIHRNAGREVCDHLLPEAKILAEEISKHGFDLVDLADDDEVYWIHARSPGVAESSRV